MQTSLDQHLQAIVTEAVRTAIGELRDELARITYSESEAAALLGLNPHQLRDARYRGEISASTKVGQENLYRREDLLEFATRNGSK